MPTLPPALRGHNTVAMLGHGSCGESYLAQAPDGSLQAIKVLKAMGTNRRLLMAAHARLAEAGGHPGIATILHSDFDARPAVIVTPFYGTKEQPSCLETWLAQPRSRELAWTLIRNLAEAMAFLHRIGVAHANLHPRNILVPDPEQGLVALTDFSQGWVAGVYQLDGNEAMLYASPEQLSDPEGIDQGLWGGWDVFSFGSLAFRILNGTFPREDEARCRLEMRHANEEMAISPSAVLSLFPATSIFTWLETSDDWEENARREIIEQCLALDPDLRYKDMREVLAIFEKIDEERGLREERERVRALRQREVQALQRSRILAQSFAAACGVLLLITLIYANRYHSLSRKHAELQVRFDRAAAENEAEMAAIQAAAARRETEARNEATEARQQADGALEKSSRIKETLIRSQEQADALFDLVRDRKPATHPGFKDATQTAAELETFYIGFLERIAEDATMESERARALSNLAVLCDARGDTAAAQTRLAAAIPLWEKLLTSDPENHTHILRLCQDLWLLAEAKLAQNAIDEASTAVKRAQSLLAPFADSGDPDQRRFIANGLLLQGRIERQRGRSAEAMALYRSACDILRTLSQQTGRYDFRSELAHNHVKLGEIAREADAPAKAATVQRAALKQLLALVEEKPEMRVPRLDLARAYGELGEIECEFGSPEEGYKFLITALEILEPLAQDDPTNTDILIQQARRWSSLARTERDQGKRVEAEKWLSLALSVLTSLNQEHPENPEFAYQLALARWQKAELAADLSLMDESLDYLRAALGMLEEWSANQKLDASLKRQIETSAAFLSGDLAHRLEEAGQSAEALDQFTSTGQLWEAMIAKYGKHNQAVDALNWCQERASKLRSK